MYQLYVCPEVYITKPTCVVVVPWLSIQKNVLVSIRYFCMRSSTLSEDIAITKYLSITNIIPVRLIFHYLSYAIINCLQELVTCLQELVIYLLHFYCYQRVSPYRITTLVVCANYVTSRSANLILLSGMMLNTVVSREIYMSILKDNYRSFIVECEWNSIEIEASNVPSHFS